MVEEIIVSFEEEEKGLRLLFKHKNFPYLLDYYFRSTVGTYLGFGFLAATTMCLLVVFKLNSRIHTKIAAARGAWEVISDREKKEAAQREWKLKTKVAELEGVIQNLTPQRTAAEPIQSKTWKTSNASSSKQEALPSASVADKGAEPKEWHFFLVSNDTEEGLRMPNKRAKFIGVVDAALKKELVAIDSGILHRKLRRMCKLSPADRAIKMEKIRKGTAFHGWYKMRLGSFRILLRFDDEQGMVRFFPASHNIYQKLYRS